MDLSTLNPHRDNQRLRSELERARRTKENFRIVNPQTILEELATIPIQEYSLKSQDPAIRHIGPVAQDFAVFGYGESDLAINM